MSSVKKSVALETKSAIKKIANEVLESTNSFGVFPTPLDRILEVNRIELVALNHFEEEKRRLLRSSSSRIISVDKDLVSAISNSSQLIYVKSDLHPIKIPFVKSHSLAHSKLDWHRATFDLLEDNKEQLSPEAIDKLEQEANFFAAEIVFQGTHFNEMSLGDPLGLKAPVKLSKEFGASMYSSMWRYVEYNPHPCALFVYNQPQLEPTSGFTVATRRRTICSESYIDIFGFGEEANLTSQTAIGKEILDNRKTDYFQIQMRIEDVNGDLRIVNCEVFDQGFNVFMFVSLPGL